MPIYYRLYILYFNLIALENMHDLKKCEFSFYLNVENVNFLSSVFKKLTSIEKNEFCRVSYLQCIHLNAAMRCCVSSQSLRRTVHTCISLTWKSSICDQSRKQNNVDWPSRQEWYPFNNLSQELINRRIFVHTLLFSVYHFHNGNRTSVCLSGKTSMKLRLLWILPFIRNELESHYSWDWRLMNWSWTKAGESTITLYLMNRCKTLSFTVYRQSIISITNKVKFYKRIQK